MRSHGAAFAPLPSWNEDEAPQHNPSDHHQAPYGSPYNSPWVYQPQTGMTTNITSGGKQPTFSQPLARYTPAHIPGYGMGLAPVEEEVSTYESSEADGREIDEFSRAYTSAGIGQASDEDRQPLRDSAQEAGTSPPSSRSPSRNRGSRPLWQQNRQQSRNLMWL
ncbi:hypothetical protein F5Y15DRAFT_414104 [Xylariaceae sp. FL0016]|nr:hypothetical protein F5Y15DRAFT_414104 [Xylariaceae sp. FL0016]